VSFALALAGVVAALGGYLLWRDIQREAALANLQAQFVASVSHELKTPLTAIRMFAETLRLRAVGNPRLQEEYLDTIIHEGERLTRLVDNVLDFSKLERGNKHYRFEKVSLTDVIDSAARTMRYPLAQSGFQLAVHADGSVPPVRADRDSLEQAVLNLLTNAMKYSGDARDIALRLHREDDQAVIAIEDHGLGIPEADQGRIFDQFFRARTEHNRLIPGAGLGLTLAAQTAKAHSGTISVRSRPGEGSTFSIRIPLEGSTS
jgi:signal transduction histidine kinase